MGNPNLGEVKGMLAGIENPKDATGGRFLSTEVWINELRLSGLNEEGGWAAVGQMNLQLADLGTISMSGNVHTIGFGQLEQRVNDRFRDNLQQFDLSTNLQLGKLLPKQVGLEIPFFANLSQTISSPEYDPYDKDITLKEKFRLYRDKRDSIRNDAVDFTGNKTFNFTNVRFAPRPEQKNRLWNISNFDFSYSFSETKQRNPLIENNEVSRTQGGIGYNYTKEAAYIEPFKKMIKSNSPWLDFIRNANFNPSPSLIGIRMDTRRQFGAIRPRNVGGGKYKIPETYDKYFVVDRNYNMRWDFTRSLNFDFKALNNSRVDEPIGRIDTRAKKDSLMRNLLKGGRNTVYNQSADLSYNVPTNLIPLFDWTTMNIAYRSTYNWVGASRLAVNLGNTIQNSGQAGATAEFNMTQLYSKFKLFRKLEESVPATDDPLAMQNANPDEPAQISESKKRKIARIKKKIAKIEKKAAKKIGNVEVAKIDTTRKKLLITKLNKWLDDAKKPREARIAKLEMPKTKASKPLSGFERTALQTVSAVKRIGMTYNEGGTTFLPGYIDSTKFLGQNWKSMAPGIDFIMGRQPDQKWLQDIAKKGLITKDPILNNLFLQNYDQKLNITAQAEPIRDLVIDLNIDKSLSKNYSTLFKDTIGSGQFSALSPYSGGGFSISYISFQTLFSKFDPNNTSATFKQFEANRIILSKRLGENNPYSKTAGADGYYKGYGRYAQDVIIPAFLAAYTKKDPTTITLLKNGDNGNVKSNPFSGYMPKPNWRMTYNGLSRIESLQEYFSNFTVSHGYTSTLSMNSFNSALLFQDTLLYGFPSFVDTVSGNFVPYFLVPNLLVSEQFSPLVGIDFSTPGQLSGRFEFRKSRQLSMSLIDFQLSEVRSTEMTFGMRWRNRDMKLPFRLPFVKKQEGATAPQNDITFALDFSIRDDINSNSRLDQANAFATGGQKVITIRPTVDVVQ
jgi:cell surface protein SprA